MNRVPENEEGFLRYSSLGETVTLPCMRFQEYENSFIYWIFSQRSETASELALGEKITVKQPERAARLEVLPDSSLRIHHLHTEDAGQYECQQHVNRNYHTRGTPVVLTLLTITADPGRDLKRGTALALQCTLVCNGVAPDNVELTWVDDEGTALQGDRFKITPSRTHSTLSLELHISDHNRRWRCNLTEGGEVKASYSYTTTLTDTPVLIATASAAAIALLIVLILIVAFCVWKRRRSDSDNHVQDEELTKESVSEIPAQVTGGAGENYSSIQFNDEGRGPERRQGPAEESNTVIYSAIK
ncbi:uncharacterized protein LOC117433889 [Acipenser ruthenus]|uniref:uncharacterized protein LOC117433889 n=1 Tax=Acipenser ruthenus TaxID=7906 RepID=UPI00274058C9|nr:uncharacterized protein LOC117433889 [Acipenser ruthenus]